MRRPGVTRILAAAIGLAVGGIGCGKSGSGEAGPAPRETAEPSTEVAGASPVSGVTSTGAAPAVPGK
jgi:hypothetical protein